MGRPRRPRRRRPCRSGPVAFVLGALLLAACTGSENEGTAASDVAEAASPDDDEGGEVPRAADLPGRERDLLTASTELFGGGGRAATTAMQIEDRRPEDAALLRRIAEHPQAEWLGNWSGDIEQALRERTTSAAQVGAVPVMVVYNIPQRDCGQYSAGGRRDADDYRAWIDALAAGIADREVVLILEPDAVGHLDCLDDRSQQLRLDLLRHATRTLEEQTGAAVYVDAGHSAWLEVDEAARLLEAAGIEHARGFALNVSNFQWDDDLIAYGTEVARAVGGSTPPHFVIDSSRNGNGPFPPEEDPTGETWCNPPGRALGQPPNLDPDVELLDAFLWVKRPGESDGTCRGGPRAGEFWREYALELVRNAEP